MSSACFFWLKARFLSKQRIILYLKNLGVVCLPYNMAHKQTIVTQ